MFNNLQEYETYLENYIDMLKPLVLISYIMELVDEEGDPSIYIKFHLQLAHDILQEEIDRSAINAQTLSFYGENMVSEDYNNLLLFSISKQGFLDPDFYNFDYEAVETIIYKGKKLVSLTTDEFRERVSRQLKLDMIKLYLRKCTVFAEEIFDV